MKMRKTMFIFFSSNPLDIRYEVIGFTVVRELAAYDSPKIFFFFLVGRIDTRRLLITSKGLLPLFIGTLFCSLLTRCIPFFFIIEVGQ